MGKVQAALAKIHRKASPASVFADRLQIPSQQEHNNQTVPTDASAIKQWIISREAANNSAGRTSTLTSAKTLLRALQHSNRTRCTPTIRLQIMEEYEKPFRRAMQALDMQYLYSDFPMQAEAEKTFLLAATLCQEMAYGYKIAVVDSLQSGSDDNPTKLLERIGNKKRIKNQRCAAIGSAFRYLTHLSLRHSQINRNWPDGIWQDLNALAGIAASDHTINQTNPLANQIDQSVTIQQQYLVLCSLYIFDQKHMTAENVRSLFVKLNRYSDLITLHSISKASDKHPTGTYSARTYSIGADDHPALTEFRLKQSNNNLMQFSLDTLLEKLGSEEESHKTSTNYNRPQRKHSRTKKAHAITAETGLSQINTRIKLTPPAEHTDAQFTDLRQLLQETESRHSAYHNLDAPNLLQQTDTPHCSTSFEVENESPGGFGLKWNGGGKCRVQIGELLAHHYRNSDNEISWHLSIVRWLHTEADGTLRLGIESLSRHTKAVDVVRGINPQQNSQRTMDGLLINYQPIDSKARMLVLTRQNYKAGEIIAYKDGKSIHTVKLIENVELAGGYQCFAIQDVSEEALTESSVNQYRMAV